MLLSLHVKNLALIDETEVDFSKGLNILTGETGAGKSIIIGSINIALGEKVSREMLRENSEYALVELIFKVENDVQRKMLTDLEVYPEEDLVIMSRRITSGRSIGRINSESVPAVKMKAVASLLIDIHGQHEHQSLLNKKKHLEILDDYAKEALGNKKKHLEHCYQDYMSILKEKESAVSDHQERAREISLLEFEMNEIENAQLKPGEDRELETEYKRLVNGKKIMESLGAAHHALSEDEISVSSQLGRAMREISLVSSYDEKINELHGQLIEIDNLTNDFNHELSEYLSETEFDDETFYQVEKRLDEINHLKTKYGDNIEIILKQKEEKEKRYENLKNYEDYLNQLKHRLSEAEEKLKKVSLAVSKIRKTHAKRLVKSVKEALNDLNFLDVKFMMDFKEAQRYGADGIDIAEFLISTNPGEPVRPLRSVASGGELSRIMLALKTILAENDLVDTLIFDEIDSGISGRTAQMVAEKMNIIGKKHQVICITHLPQIAAMADHHLLIQKSIVKNATISNIDSLTLEESIRELARMLGGVKVTQTVIDSAKEMKELALSVKKSQT